MPVKLDVVPEYYIRIARRMLCSSQTFGKLLLNRDFGGCVEGGIMITTVSSRVNVPGQQCRGSCQVPANLCNWDEVRADRRQRGQVQAQSFQMGQVWGTAELNKTLWPRGIHR